MAEAVLCAVPIKTIKILGIPKSFALVLTNQRTILISLTSDMLKQAAIDARDDAAAEGKGFMGKWAAQMKATLGYTSRFLDMSIPQTRGNTKRQHLQGSYQNQAGFRW